MNKPAPTLKTRLLRLVGPVLLVILLLRLDVGQVADTLRAADVGWVALAAAGVLPLIFIKTLRWRGLLRVHHISLPVGDAYLVYFSSLFIGFLTPGRLGEFIRAVYVARSCDVSLSRGVAGVLADRLFDFYALLVIGSLALLNLFPTVQNVTLVLALALGLIVPLVLFMHRASFAFIQRIGLTCGVVGRKLLHEADGVLPRVRRELGRLGARDVLYACGLTILAYGLFYGQGYLLARALGIDAGFVRIMFAVALGSLVTLIPVSIAGLGTRELAIITYLEAVDVDPAAALGFSLLIFFNFQVVGGIIGAIAWWIKPVPVQTAGSPAEAP